MQSVEAAEGQVWCAEVKACVVCDTASSTAQHTCMCVEQGDKRASCVAAWVCKGLLGVYSVIGEERDCEVLLKSSEIGLR